MAILDNLFGAPKKDSLLEPAAFTASYSVAVTNEFTMGRDNPVLSLNTESQITVKQELEKNRLYNTVTLNSISGHTESEHLKPRLEQMLALAGISKKMVIERNSRGKMVRIANMRELEQEWAVWREHQLPDVVTGEKQQTVFAAHYEKGLQAMEKNIKNNLNYFILLPEIFFLKKHAAQGGYGSEMQLPSKLVEDMVIRYRFAPVQVNDTEKPVVQLQAEILNRNEMYRHHLEELYKAQQEFDISAYGFSIELGYVLEKSTGKIISGNLFLKEKMHAHLQYLLHISANEIVPPTEPQAGEPVKTKRRSFLAD